MRRLLLVLGILVLFAAALVAGLVVALPWAARPMLAGMLSVRIGRPVSIGGLSWDLTGGMVTADELAIGTAAERFSARRVTVAFDLTRLTERDVVLDLLLIEGADGTVALDAGQFAGDDDGEGAGPRLYVPIEIRELRAVDGQLAVRGPGGTEARLVADELVATDIALGGGVGTDVRLAATFTGTIDGVPLTATANVDIAGGERTVSVVATVRDYPVPDGLLPLPPPLESASGTVTAETRLTIAPAPPRHSLDVDLRVAQARVRAAGAALAARTVTARTVRIDLDARRIDLGAVAIDTPEMSVDLARLPAPQPAGNGAAGERPWDVRSDAITVRGGQVRLRGADETLALQVASVRWDGLREAPEALALRLQGADGGTLVADGSVRAAPLTLDLTVRADAMPVAPWARLLESPVQLRRGTIGGRAHVVYDGGWRTVDATLRATDVHTEPPDPARPKEVMAVATADADVAITVAPEPSVTVRTLSLSWPYVLALRHSGGFFPLSLVEGEDRGAAPRPAAAKEADAAPRRPPVRIERLAVDNGKLEFLDETVTPTFWSSLTSISAEAEGIAVDELTIERFTISGLRDELSPVRLSGTLTRAGFDGEAAVRELLLDSLNPYVAPVLGYQLTAGRLSSTVRTRPSAGVLEATADVVLRGVDVLQTGRDVILEQSGVPLPVALRLLTGVGGSIDLTLPFSVNTESGDVAVGSVVWQAVRKAIVSALSTPLRVLGSLFGLGGAPHAFAIDPVPFATGARELDAAGSARIGEIARILEAQQGLLLVLLPQITAEDIAAVGNDNAAALAAARNKAVRDAFVSGDNGPALAPGRILLAEWKPENGAQATGRPGVYVELQDAP